MPPAKVRSTCLLKQLKKVLLGCFMKEGARGSHNRALLLSLSSCPGEGPAPTQTPWAGPFLPLWQQNLANKPTHHWGSPSPLVLGGKVWPQGAPVGGTSSLASFIPMVSLRGGVTVMKRLRLRGRSDLPTLHAWEEAAAGQSCLWSQGSPFPLPRAVGPAGARASPLSWLVQRPELQAPRVGFFGIWRR